MDQLLKPFGAGRPSCCLQQVQHTLVLEIAFTFLICPVFQPSFASFSDIFGRRPIVLLAIFFFCIGAIVSAISKNFTYMLVGRTIQGVGGGGIIALTEIIITDIVPLRFRGQYFGIMSAMWSIGSVTGPILGGGFAENVTWVYTLTNHSY